MINDILQIGAVVVLLIICIVWIIRRIRRRIAGECDDVPEECAGCSLAEHCRKKGKPTDGTSV